ncbi:heterokaryon incompatibility protein-domain-containing protein [Cercophora newfieldiana]|uniref:Heterokaryon incompatibility protein-domain-containing protein n=1 Tax=Cercophora newfieldiana TaxID=92897 RepID=A0AA39YD15_9PEZI|nr:heterokaryon incompatibility protein-domain-containing protein [Cercophora newfieldiana]
MRLINTRTLDIKEFTGGALPPYAILSHTWGDEELTLQDMLEKDKARRKAGFAKVEECCRQALKDGLEWAWVDTCCIDKTSSAELSETINSMFKFYEQSMKCYAVLTDIKADQWTEWTQTKPPEDDAQQPSDITPEQIAQFPIFSSRWWSRGWTLQELIAPYDVEFYSQEWQFLTSKQACKRLINRKYGIALSILDHSAPLASIRVAERMSWACCRYTTREEDMAYCLLGLFGVNMPLLYGEGSRAFIRLQEQIISSTEDYTLFLWGLWTPDSLVHVDTDETPSSSQRPRASILQTPLGSILAASPRDFSNNQSWWSWTNVNLSMPVFGEPLQLTNRGLRLTLFVKQITVEDMESQSPLSHSLNDFFRCLSDDGFGDFVTQFRPRRGLSMRLPYLGAFQCYSQQMGLYQPCVLLLRLKTPMEKFYDTATFVFARLMWFSTTVNRADIEGNEQWSLRTCYIKTSTDEELLGRGLSLGHQVRPWISYNFWTWRTASKHFQQLALNVSTTEAETRRCLHIQPHGTFPGCLILVAARKGRYWIGHEAGAGIDVDVAAERFKMMELESVWVKSAREVGPIGADCFEFGTGKLFTTLVINRLGVFDRYKVSLAIMEREGAS